MINKIKAKSGIKVQSYEEAPASYKQFLDFNQVISILEEQIMTNILIPSIHDPVAGIQQNYHLSQNIDYNRAI